jgi:monoterpene epsilon-lactone hydrolase
MTERSARWALPSERVGYPAPAALVQRRVDVEAMQRPSIVASVEISEARYGGVRCMVVTPEAPDRRILFVHGGAFRLGSAETALPFTSRIAAAASAQIVVPDYRLAPEFPFPAALRDVAMVYASLREESGRRLIAAGDSAGGGLAASIAAACGRNGVPTPDGLVLISPWLDLTVQSQTFDSRAGTDIYFSRAAAGDASELYLQGHDPLDPLVSPAFADVTDFPPSLVLAGSEEVLLGDSMRFVERLALARVSVHAFIAAGMQHVWPTSHPEFPDSVIALDLISRFVRTYG